MQALSERLRIALEIRGLKQSDLVAMTGIGKSSISTYLSGEYEPKQRSILKICNALNVSESWLLGYDVPMERKIDISFSNYSAHLPDNIVPLPSTMKIPLIGTIACGEPILAQENIEDHVDAPENIKADFALRCKGDSMIGARINDGDIVYIRQQPDVENGEIAAVLIGDEATLKRVYKSDDTLMLVAANDKYEPFTYSGDRLNEIRILGKAVAFLSVI